MFSQKILHRCHGVRLYFRPYARPYIAPGFHLRLYGNLATKAGQSFHDSQRIPSDKALLSKKVLPSHEAATDHGHTQKESAVSFSTRQFNALDKDVTILKFQVADIKGRLKDLHPKLDSVKEAIDHKFYAVMALIVASVVVEGAIDLWGDERKGSTR